MKSQIIISLISLLLKFLSPELIMKFFTFIKDKIENLVEGTETTVDDVIWGSLQGQWDEVKMVADAAIDFCKEYVLGTASTVDDALVLPILKNLEEALELPDD